MLIIQLRYLTVDILNKLFSISSLSLVSLNYFNTLYMSYQCFIQLFKQITILSKYAKQYMSNRSYNTQLIYYQNTIGALVSLNSITKYLYILYYILKAIFYLLPTYIYTQLNIVIISTLLIYFTLTIYYSVFIIKGKG